MQSCETCRFWKLGRKTPNLGTCMAALERARAVVPASVNLDVTQMFGHGGRDCPGYVDKRVKPKPPTGVLTLPHPASSKAPILLDMGIGSTQPWKYVKKRIFYSMLQGSPMRALDKLRKAGWKPTLVNKISLSHSTTDYRVDRPGWEKNRTWFEAVTGIYLDRGDRTIHLDLSQSLVVRKVFREGASLRIDNAYYWSVESFLELMTRAADRKAQL